MDQSDKTELLLAIADLKVDVMINRTLIEDVKKHYIELKPTVKESDNRISSLEQSRKTALGLISALWAVIAGSLITYWTK